MRRNKAGYICLMITVAAMLIFFEKTFFLWILVGLIILITITSVAIRKDAKKIQIHLKTKSGVQEGKEYQVTIRVEGIEKLKTCGYILVELESYEKMFENKKRKRYLIPLSDQTNDYEVEMKASCCGETRFYCTGAWAVDYFSLFRIPINKFKEAHMMVYPRSIRLQVELSKDAIGATREDVNMRTREGNDPSEMYDVREYVPGDDLRSVHWKLSSKVDQLLLRQSSDPTHYNVVLLPDFGNTKLKEEGQISTDFIEQVNGAVAIGAEIGRQLIEKREGFCMALPTQNGLQVFEIQNKRQLEKTIAIWLSTPIPKIEGAALRYFSMEHLEQYFSRLVILSAGEYEHNPNGLEKRIGITIVSCVKESQIKHEHAQKYHEITEIFADLEKENIYRIIC